MKLEFKPIALADEWDHEGCLVLQDDRLVAVLSHLSDAHPGSAGQWFMECGFGPLSGRTDHFADLATAETSLITVLEANPR